MLLNWYKYFPALAIYAIHRFVKCIDGQNNPFGSWRDIKYLCQFISTHSDLQQEHSFIDVCCDLMNSQLDLDLDIQHMYALPKHRQSISNVAKWIPREHKQSKRTLLGLIIMEPKRLSQNCIQRLVSVWLTLLSHTSAGGHAP